MATKPPDINIDTLAKFFPLNALGYSELEILASQLSVVSAKRNKILIECGQSDNNTLFLIKGQVELTADDGKSYIIKDGTPQSLRPISHLNPHRYTVRTVSQVDFIRVDNRIIDNLLHKQPHDGETVEDLYVSQEMLQNPIFQDIYRDLVDDKLVIPTFPEIAIKIQRLVEQDVDLRQVEQLIQFDPATATMIVKAANSALFNIGKPVQTIEQAILRMGMRLVKQLVITYSIRELFNSESTLINNRMKRLWKHSAEVAAASFVLAKKLGKWDAEHALLLGLLHDIGMLPILKYAERYPDMTHSEEMIDATIHQLHGDIGAIILKTWNFSEDFITTSDEADDWYRDKQSEPDYCDIVLLAQLHSFIGKSNEKLSPLIGRQTLPVITDLPAFKKLCPQDCGPDESIALLNEAKQQIMETVQLLSM